MFPLVYNADVNATRSDHKSSTLQRDGRTDGRTDRQRVA